MAIDSVLSVYSLWNGAAIEQKVNRAIAQGLQAAAIFLAGRVKELLSVPAPRKAVIGTRGKSAGVRYYRATADATPGAPPRKLSGRLRGSIAWDVNADGTRARVGSSVVYSRRLELGHPAGHRVHAYLMPSLTYWKDSLAQIIGKEAVP